MAGGWVPTPTLRVTPAFFYGSGDAGGGGNHWLGGAGPGVCQPEGRMAGAFDLAAGGRVPFPWPQAVAK